MKKRSLYHSIMLTMLVFLSGGCVETIISVRVLPDGHYTMQFHSKGDSSDVFNRDFPHPEGPGWTQSVSSEQEDETIIWTVVTGGIRSGTGHFPDSSDSPVPLRHTIDVEKTDGWIATSYNLRYTYRGRSAYLKYPEFAKQATGVAHDSTKWIGEALHYIVSSALNDLQDNPLYTLSDQFLERLQNHSKGYFAHIQEEDLFEELDHTFLRRAFRPFLKELPDGFVAALQKSMDPHEQELRLTSDLSDDEFTFNLFLPGTVTSANADTIVGDTLRWSFNLKEFVNDDYRIEASSIVYSPTRVQAVILIVTAMVLLGLWFLSRRKIRS